MAWSKDYYKGTTRGIFPTIKDKPKEERYIKPPPAMRQFMKSCQDFGMVVGLFCTCGGELIAELHYMNGLRKSPTAWHYFCPDCHSTWDRPEEPNDA